MPLLDFAEPFFLTFVFLLGTIVGSFLNVVALRYNTGHTLEGRSHCFSCKRTLVWYELLPIASFLFLRGKCRTCGSVLSLQYPLVELFTGLLLVGLFLKGLPTLLFVGYAIIFCLYIVIAIYDIRHLIVPNGLAYAAAILAFITIFIDIARLTFVVPSLAMLFAGPLIALPLFLLWLLSMGRWMGLGDAKLMLSVGWLLGLLGGVAALLIAFWAGALFGLSLLLYNYVQAYRVNLRAGKSALLITGKRPTMKHEIPFAPFLLLGFFIVFLLDITLFDLILW